MVVGDQHPHPPSVADGPIYRAGGTIYRPVGRQLSWEREADRGAAPRPRLDRQLAADQQRPLAHAGDPEPALGLVEGEAAAVVGDDQLDAAAVRSPQSHLDSAGPAVASGVGERLLGDPVDDQLGVVVEVGEVAVGRDRRLDLPVRQLLDLSRDRRCQAEVVERGRAQLAGEREQLAHRLVGERLGLGQFRLQLRRRRLARRLEPQQQPGQRLVDLVVEVAGDPRPLLLLGLQRRGPGAPPLGFQPSHHPQEGELDPLHLLGLADAVDRGRQQRPGSAQVDLLHLLDQPLERSEATFEANQADREARPPLPQVRESPPRSSIKPRSTWVAHRPRWGLPPMFNAARRGNTGPGKRTRSETIR